MRTWRPSASQRKEFAIRMSDPDEAKAYQQRKEIKAEKRRSGSNFNYSSSGGSYVPTLAQYQFCMNHSCTFTPEQEDAANQLIYGYTCQERVSHDYIHVINELIRKNGTP